MHNQRQVRMACVLWSQFTLIYHRCLSFDSNFLRQDVPLFSADGSVFYTILPAKQGARGEFHHIAGLTAQVRFGTVKAQIKSYMITDDSGFFSKSSYII